MIGSPILIVDDEPVMRIITESVLVQQGFSVRTAASAEEALAALAEGYLPQLILLDVLMPGLNGFETCRRLRADSRFEHLPIIMLTALDDQESIDEAYRCGATDFITKPLNMPLLPHRIRYLLRSAATFQQLLSSRETLVTTQKIAHLGDWELDGHGNLVNCSREYREMLGIDRLPRSAAELSLPVHREDSTRLKAARAGLRLGYSYQLDYRLTDPAGRLKHLHEVGYPKTDSSDSGAYGYTQDISERVAAEEQVRNLAWYDPLTGLKNRSRMSELMARDLVDSEGRHLPLNLFFIQIPGLRKFSLLFGQSHADAALLALSQRLKNFIDAPATALAGLDPGLLRQADLGRYDEFAFLLALPTPATRQTLQQLAAELAATISAPLCVLDEEVLPAPAIGVSRCPDDAREVEELIRCALHSATLAAGDGADPGGKVVFFDPAWDAEAASRHILERQLRAAIDSGDQLLLYYQPKIDARSERPVGAEVLLRWQHPERGLVSPMEFIPLAERSGLIKPMTDWLLAQVVEQLAQWQAMGLAAGKISINMSAHSFYGGSLVRLVDDVLVHSGVPGSALIIEITEGTLVHDRDAALQVLTALRQRQIGISLDDFGTGYSSLAYLQRFPIDEIKVDRSFVIDIARNPGNQALVGAVVGLGHALRLSVVAEGVETPEQAACLGAMGCDVLQGYLFARPMPSAEYTAYLDANQRRSPP